MSSPRFHRLSLPTQTIYARLLDELLATEFPEGIAGVSLVSKRIRDRTYWYAQRREGDKKIQTYLGPSTPKLEDVVEGWRRARGQRDDRAELVAMARAGGAYVLSAAEAQVLSLLAPVFRMGGVLVGSQAFAVLGSLLGVRWQDAIVRTADIDLAHDHRIGLALDKDIEPLKLDEVLGDAVPLFPILNPTDPATSFRVRGAEIDVELLTPLIGKERKGPIRIAALSAAATPLRFLDYLIEETQPAAALGGQGVLVHVPRPGRFALHKLIVAARRGARGGTKAAKDRAQAAALLDLLASDLPGEITLAWKALAARGKGWVAAVRSSVARLDADVVERLSKLGIRPTVR